MRVRMAGVCLSIAVAGGAAACTAGAAERAGRRVYQGAAEKEASAGPDVGPAAAETAAAEPVAPGDAVDRSALEGIPLGKTELARAGRADEPGRRARRKVDEEAEEGGEFFA